MTKKNKKNQNRRQNKQTNKKGANTNAIDNDKDLLTDKMNLLSLNFNKIDLSDQPSGLPNLGNTCYFNSVMQVMGQTYILYHMLKKRCQNDFIWNAKTFYLDKKLQHFASESLQVKLPQTPNSLITDFLKLQQQIFQQKYEIISLFKLILLLFIFRSPNPRALLSDIQREKQQFKGYLQQDAQELLINLLDALKKVEISRQQRALIEGLKIQDTKNPTEENIEKAQRYKISAKHTIINAIFDGQLLSIIHCSVCDYRSFTFEAFMDLPLSLNCEKNISENIEILKRSANKTKNSSSEETDSDTDKETNDPEPKQKLTLSDRKKKRAEKKAARRMERLKRKKELNHQQLTNNDEDSNDNLMVNGKNFDQSLNENTIESDNQSPFGIPELLNNEICSKRIEEDFRYKFYLFAHQRMCHTDDIYQNLDLGTLLRNFTKEEILDGPNKYLCENCSKKNNGKKTYSKAIRCQLIALPPPVLILQLKRFEASSFSRKMVPTMHKLCTRISFPEKLYLSPYTSRIYKYFSQFYESKDDDEFEDDKKLEYTLYGVIIHSGSLRFGHYMAYVCVRKNSFKCKTLKRFVHLKPFVSNIEHIIQFVYDDLVNQEKEKDQFGESNGTIDLDVDHSDSGASSNNDERNCDQSRKWYFISDSSVSPSNINSVLTDCTSPYLLFYERTK